MFTLPPTFVRNILYPLHERLVHRSTFAYLEELERSQWLSREELEVLQMTKVKHLLLIACEHCPWHANRIRAAGMDLQSEKLLTMEDLRRLPTMSRQDIQRHGSEMVWREAPGGAFPYNTGGSTGEPLQFYFGRSRQASDAAGRMRARQWWGVDVGDKEVYLWGAPAELAKADRIKTMRDRVVNHLLLNAFEMSPANMDVYLEAITAYQPSCLYGYASSLALLAAHAKTRGLRLKLRKLKVVCTTGEPLYSHQRELLSEVFGVPSADEFGSRDIGFTAHESPDRQMLLVSESIILEVLDAHDRPVAPGRVGEAVLTGLTSDTQPFIRYRTGDLIRHTEERCKGRRALHVLGEIEGRTTDFLVCSDGTIMHALAVIYVLRAIAEVTAFKVIQRTVRDLEILVVPGERWSDEVRHRIESAMRQRLGNELRTLVRLVASIPPEHSGKHRYVVSQVPLPSELQASV